jgi:hypothetical protein
VGDAAGVDGAEVLGFEDPDSDDLDPDDPEPEPDSDDFDPDDPESPDFESLDLALAPSDDFWLERESLR